ncbi:Na+/H+ antiporter subunit E [Saccharothrix isguenensis]
MKRILLGAWLWALWLLLWGSLSPVVVVGGLLATIGVLVAFPPRGRPGRAGPRPVRLLQLIAGALLDLARSSVVVAWSVVRHGPRTRTAIVEVPLRVRSNVEIAATANVTSLTPGTLVVHIDRDRRLLYVHTLPIPADGSTEQARRVVRTVERRVARVFGTPLEEEVRP